MRILSAIDAPLADEHVIGTDPPLRPELPGVWRRRINPFTGRALSDRALTAEQEARAGLQRLRGQSVTPGVIAGLDLLAETDALGQRPDRAQVQILSGSGLTHAGEDIVIAAPRRLRLADLAVRARVDQLDAIAARRPAGGTPAASGVLLPRRLGPALGALITEAAAADLPRIAVLVAEPVTVTILAGPHDACQPDPRDDPYDDLQRIDGCRLVLELWPAELAAYAPPPQGALRRNRLAARIFAAEASFDAVGLHPWQETGVALALLAFDERWRLEFVDRAAVLRMGGQPRPRSAAVQGGGTSLLWQARLAQLVEHLGALPDLAPVALRAALRHLPPVGVLPATLMDLGTKRQFLFPPGFSLSAAPVPLGELELALREGAGLAPLDLEAPDEVELLVPVPDRVYEPGLLLTAEVDPAFARAVARYTADRTAWLVRREVVRRRRDLLADAVTGERPTWPATDAAPQEVLPKPTARAPVGCTRLRRLAATATQAGTQMMLRAGSTLPIRASDRLFLWLRIPAAGVTGISMRVGSITATSGAAGLTHGVFWGAQNGLVIGTGDTQIALRRQGNLPAPGAWTRLEVPAAARWTASGNTLAGLALDGLEVSVIGGAVEWGPLGRIGADDMEAVWIADDAPPGSALSETGRTGPGWTQRSAGEDEVPAEDAYGTAEAGGVRTILSTAAFATRWPQLFLAPEIQRLHEIGLDRFIADTEARLRTTNDRIDMGFLRAQADIYRLRQLVLGGDTASRLVTSPALADIAARQESARAQNNDLDGFLKAAWQTAPTRDAAEPLERQAKPKTTPGANTGGTVTPRADPRLGDPITNVALGLSQPLLATNVSFVGVAQNEQRFTSIAGLSKSIGMRFTDATDVRAQLPLIGRVERTASIAERLKPAPAIEAQRYALEGKMAVIGAVATLIGKGGAPPIGIALADLPAPGFRFPGKPETVTLKAAIEDLDLPQDRRKTADDDDMKDGAHEAAFFGAGAAAIDNTIALLRHIEGRAELYARLIAEAKALREELGGRIAAADARLRTIAVEVEEARHDLGVAEALLAEETERVFALNAKRRAVLADNVTAIAYRRARHAGRSLATPAAPAAAGLVPAPAVACLGAHEGAPEEIRDYVALFRDAPVAWFPHVARRLALLDRLDVGRAMLAAARMRATMVPLPVAATANLPKLLGVVQGVLAAQRAVLEPRRAEAVRLDLAAVATLDLSGIRRLVQDRASLGDLVSGEHNRPELARYAAEELESIARVAGCLHAAFGEAEPAIRLGWAELLSGFDEPAPLAILAGLPGWSELPITLRREQQGLVDWLFDRVDRAVPRAEAAMAELVRICLLMAAHAPVDRVIPARLVSPVTVRPGVRLELALDMRAARIGMTALLRDAEARPVGTAVVEDLADGVARARIVKTLGTGNVTLAAGLRVELTA